MNKPPKPPKPGRADKIWLIPCRPYEQGSKPNLIPTPFKPGDEIVATLTMTNTQECVVNIKVVDKKGQPAELQGTPTLRSSDETIVTVSVNPKDGTGKTALVRSEGGVGQAKVVATGDADLGEGTKLVFGSLDCNITSGGAAAITIEPGTPVEQESAPEVTPQ